MDRADRAFDDLVRDRTGPDFIERSWLHERIQEAHGSHVLVTGEPGAGKTTLLAGLARAHPDWLRYFARRDSRTALAGGDVQSFLLEIGHQLARRRPGLFEPQRLEVVVRQHIDTVLADGSVVGIRIEDLSVSPFHRTASLYVEQRLGEVAGSARGIEIGTAGLEPRLLEPANLAHLALIGPAEVLLAEDPAARIVILLDALDEFADGSAPGSLLRWLAQGPELPLNVVLVMTSRPHAALAPLRQRAYELSIDPDSAQVTGDLMAYATRVLGTRRLRATAEAAGLYPDVLLRDAVRHAAGNFLYLSTYARALTGAVEAADGPLCARLLDLAELPHRLNGLYAFFIDVARSDLGSLGMLDVREPTGPADRLTPAWEGAGQPLLGVLAVAREPLTVDRLTVLAGLRVWPRAVRNLLTRLRWLLDERDGRIALYHSSIGEFLTADRTYREHPNSWVDALEWHERIVRHYRGDAATWAAVPWHEVDRYGLLHVADHALCAGDDIAAEAVDGLACSGLLRAHRRAFGNHRHFQRLTSLLADHAVDRLSPGAALPALLHLGVVRRRLLGISRTVAPPALGLLARLGRVDEALEHVAAMEPSYQQFRGILAIWEHLPHDDDAPEPHDRPDRPELLELLIRTAFAVPATTDRYGRVWRSTAPFRQSAVLLAPYDLDRALRLWQHAWDIEFADRGANAPALTKAPDAVYAAAAAAEQDTARATALIARIGDDATRTPSSLFGTPNDRPGAYLDLAARAGAADVPGLLRLAEEGLATARQTTRLPVLGRLAAAWAPYDPAEAQRLLTALRDEAGPEHLSSFDFSGALVDAVTEIAGAFPATARHLLERVLQDPVNEATSRVGLHLARLTAAYGDTERARDLIDRVQELWYEGARAGAALATFDRAGALRLLERAYDRLPPADDPDQRSMRDAHLKNVALEMIRHDRHRAARMARELTDTAWDRFEYDRYSTLARIAHASLDQGDSEHAQALLDECLQAAETVPPLAGGRPSGFYRPATGAPAMPIGQTYLTALSATYNTSHEWSARANSYFYRDPADVLRAVSLGPYNWGRTARILAEALADRDVPRAVAVVDGLTDGDERTIGLAGLLRRAALAGRPEARALSVRLDEALAALPAYEWLAAGDHDDKAWAYERPDHRVRFETAVRVAPFRPEAGKLVEGTPFLSLILQLAQTSWASQAYADSVLGGVRHRPEDRALHERTLSSAWLPENHHLLIDLTRAAAAFHEHRAASGEPARPHPARPTVRQPIYAAAAEAVTPAGCQGPTPAAFAAVRGLLDEGLVVAAAQLTAFAAEVHPGAAGSLHPLATEVIAATAETSPMTRVDALARLSLTPAFADLVDPADVLRETARPGVLTTGQPWVRGQVRRLLFSTLLTRSPAVALRQFHDAVADSWEDAMALLEHAAAEILDALGPDAVTILHTAILRALSCTSPDGTAPECVDGLRSAPR